MKTAKFWLVQIAMVAILSLAFGSPVFATPPDHAKAGKAVTSAVTADEDGVTHGEEMRLENATLGEGKADWKTPVVPDPDPTTCPDGTFPFDQNGNGVIEVPGECF